MAKTITIGKFVYKHYIDRDALLDFAHNHKDGQIGCNDIARFPTADVVEVVRCKDCIHSTTITEPICGTKTLFCTYDIKPVAAEPTYFCAYGEKGSEKE